MTLVGWADADADAEADTETTALLVVLVLVDELVVDELDVDDQVEVVEGGVQVLVGVGVGVEEVVVCPDPKTQVPKNSPWLMSSKNSKREGVRSKPPAGQVPH